MTINGIIQISAVSCAVLVSACSQNSHVVDNEVKRAPAYQSALNSNFAKILSASNPRDKDRAAILAMQGEYKVDFNFEETVVLQAGYKRYPSKHSGAYETVLVIQDTPTHIILQHILVVGDGHVVKHWRQDWHYEAKARFEFVAHQTWETKALPSEKTTGAWTQCVYEVSDAPRYCGTGLWNHRYGVSTWTSDRTWRPLPRREYTIRDDYNALNVENRHTVTSQGWTHEQDNTKAIRAGTATQTTLVREFGFNNYRRIQGYDFSPAYHYWEKTAKYWRQVRQAWSERFTDNTRVVLNTEVDGMPIIEATFGHAEAIEKGMETPSKRDVDEVLNRWVSANLD